MPNHRNSSDLLCFTLQIGCLVFLINYDWESVGGAGAEGGGVSEGFETLLPTKIKARR